jgi:hypothetical protein
MRLQSDANIPASCQAAAFVGSLSWYFRRAANQ